MDISALIQSLVSPEMKQQVILKQPATFNLNQLPLGTELTGQVINTNTDGMVLMDFGKFVAYAKITFPVEKGQTLHLNVVKNEDQLTMKAQVPVSAERVAASQNTPKIEVIPTKLYNELLKEIETVFNRNTSLPQDAKIPPQIHHALEKLDGFFEPVAIGKGVFKMVSQLKAFVEDSGIFFEKKIQRALLNLMRTSLRASTEELGASSAIKQIIAKDLKPDLLVLREYFSDPDAMKNTLESKSLLKLRGAVDQLLGNIDQQQHFSLNRSNNPDTVQVFTYSLPFKDENQKAKFKVYYPKKKPGGGGASHRVSLLLEMDRLGVVRADLVPVDKDLNISFFVENEDTQKMIEAELGELMNSLGATFNNFYLKAMVSPKKIDRFEREDIATSNSTNIDVRA